MSFPTYANYKRTDIKWLGALPSHWDVSPYKRLVDIQNGADHKHIEQDEGYPVIGSGGVFAYASEYMYDGESVLLGRKGTVDKPLFVTGRFWTVDTMYWTKISPESSARFAYYTALTIPFDYYSTNTALPSMTKGALHAHQIALPPLAEQEAIAAFLDHETSKIDALVDEQKRLIELLKEKRQAVISHAVTKGLDPTVPMKDSGVEWLDQVPTHWVVGAVKRFFQSFDGKRIPLSSEERGSMSGEYPYYGASGVIDSIDQYIFEEDLVLVSEDGANLINRSTPIAFVARGKYWVNNHAHILKPIDDNLVFWAARIELLDLVPFVTGAAQPKLTADALSNLLISVPPTSSERAAIEKHIISVLLKFDPLVAEAEAAISLLQERRSALVSAAVTGKIDVRNWREHQKPEQELEPA